MDAERLPNSAPNHAIIRLASRALEAAEGAGMSS